MAAETVGTMTEPATRTTVVNARGVDHAAIRADPRYAYVGRWNSRCGFEASPFANPFKIGLRWADVCRILRCQDVPAPYEVLDAAAAVRLYAYWLQGQTVLLDLVPSLKGKILVCWCVDWDGEGEPKKPCHAVVLARLADETAADAEALARAMALPVESRYDITREAQS